MNRTSIEWVKNVNGTPGFTVNPMTGCLNQTDGLCKGGDFPCYAYLQSKGRCHQQDLKGEPINPIIDALFGKDKMRGSGKSINFGIDSFFPRIHKERFAHLVNAPCGAGIFVDDRSDWAASYWPEWCQTYIIVVARIRPDIRLYLLTKQPQELPKWSPFPDNAWVGVTVTTNGMASLAYTAGLSQIKAAVRFISFEPLLGQIGKDELRNLATVSDWWIIGAQTKPYKPPEITWVREIVDAADVAEIPIFLKNNLLELVNYISPETKFAFNKKGYYRQEMPPVASF
jgi:protein gp37